MNEFTCALCRAGHGCGWDDDGRTTQDDGPSEGAPDSTGVSQKDQGFLPNPRYDLHTQLSGSYSRLQVHGEGSLLFLSQETNVALLVLRVLVS